MEIKTVTVIGANGVMGRNIAGIFASFGNATVYLVSRKLEDSVKAKELSAKSVKADEVKDRLIPTTYENLEYCLSVSDLVFESVAEDFGIKSKINQRIDACLKGTATIATGTSGLSVNELAKDFDIQNRNKYLGLHFFNPPYAMPLCEIIPTEYTDESLINSIKDYLSNTLYRKIIVTKDFPSFLANRIGFFFINFCMQLAEKYADYGGIDYIDSIFGGFSGRNMPPIRTADFVGLDVHKAIVDNIRDNCKEETEYFILPEYVEILIKEGKLGKKVNEGLYKTVVHENGTKTYMVYDISTSAYRPIENYNFSFATQMVNFLRTGDYRQAFEILKNNKSQEAEICLNGLLRYLIYAINCNKNVAYDKNSMDTAMANGFNWIPPIALIQALGGVEDTKALVKDKLGMDIDEDKYFDSLTCSEYDFRTFFKAKK